MGVYIFLYFATKSQLRNIILGHNSLYRCYVIIRIQFDIATCYLGDDFFYGFYGIFLYMVYCYVSGGYMVQVLSHGHSYV
jgi:hypothetical protein